MTNDDWQVSELRRPGIRAIYEELREANPKKPDWWLMAHAKTQWHERRKSGKDAAEKGATWI